MAINAATMTGDFAGYLKPDQAAPYFAQARQNSIVQALAREVPLGANGVEVPIVTSKATAGWVAEGGQKPASNGALGLKTLTPKKIAAIAVVSAEVVRANPGNYIQLFKDDVAEAMALAFDAAVLHGTNSPFGAGQNLDATTKAVELTSNSATHTMYDDVVAALSLLVAGKKKLTGFAFDSIEEPRFLGGKDASGRPLFLDSPYADTALTSGRIIGRKSIMADGIATADGTSVVGYAGDWSQIVWGRVGGITYDVSTEATVTINGVLTSLWEHNLVAIRAETEFGALINDTGSFVKFTNATVDA